MVISGSKEEESRAGRAKARIGRTGVAKTGHGYRVCGGTEKTDHCTTVLALGDFASSREGRLSPARWSRCWDGVFRESVLPAAARPSVVSVGQSEPTEPGSQAARQVGPVMREESADREWPEPGSLSGGIDLASKGVPDGHSHHPVPSLSSLTTKYRECARQAIHRGQRQTIRVRGPARVGTAATAPYPASRIRRPRSCTRIPATATHHGYCPSQSLSLHCRRDNRRLTARPHSDTSSHTPSSICPFPLTHPHPLPPFRTFRSSTTLLTPLRPALPSLDLSVICDAELQLITKPTVRSNSLVRHSLSLGPR